MNKNICPLCKNTNTALYAKSNYDINNINEYSFSSRKNPEYMHYTLMKCKDCDLLYSVDIVNKEKFYDMYAKAGFDSKNEANFASKTYIEYFNKFYKQTHTGGGYTIDLAMDIGTGEGSFLKELLNYGIKNVIGVEPSNEAINQADETVKEYILNCFFNADNFSDKKFDLITCFQAIEHIENPLNLFNDIYKLLNKNGALFIVCHSYNSFVNRLLGMKSPIYDIEHLQIFSKKSVKRIFELSGFKNIEVFSIYNNYPLSYWVKLFPFPNKIKKILLKLLNITLIGNLKIPINVGNIGCIGYKI
ncbi:class I SAM-dependent methyltransferase [Brachyspira sp.]|uniref:class I SAM-dependent methyltransferase n=1 Tax=Brachyspira sp. TaxID=1977261 RepID=UPI0026217A13|nr:class I SAM-dependent methyltransferase [Brachyspira sp.]